MELSVGLSALIMGFLGSWHCGVMCGPLSCNFKKNNQFISYHLGRLASYLLMATLLFSGSQIMISMDSRPLKIISSLLFAGVFIYFGLKQLELINDDRKLTFFSKFQIKLLKYTQKISQKFPVVLGLLTGLLPCAWLYSFLILASQMKNYGAALTLVIIFWMTSLPVFFVFNRSIQALIIKSHISYRKIAGIVLIAAGVLSLLGHWSHLVL